MKSRVRIACRRLREPAISAGRFPRARRPSSATSSGSMAPSFRANSSPTLREIERVRVNPGERARPLLLSTYSAADAFPITNLTLGASHSEQIVRGRAARWARFDPRPCPMPPDWSKQGGYKSIFAHQQREPG